MSPLIWILLLVVALSIGGFALAPVLNGSSRADKRKKALQGDVTVRRRENQAERTREARRRNIQQAVKAQSEELRDRKRVPLQSLIYQAGLKTTKQAFIRNSVIVGVVILVLTFILQVPIWFCPIFGLAGGYLLPRFWLGRKRKKLQAQFLDELPNAVEAIVRGVKSGLPLNDSMRLVAKEAKEPLRSEFQRVLDQQAVGKSMAEAVNILYDRVPLPEVNFFIVVINVQQQAGGNLSEALGNLSRVLRNRKKMKAKVKAMSSEAKASAGIIGALPFLVACLVSVTSPTYLLPLFTTTIGNIWLGIAALMLTIGVMVMRKMVQFEI